eukprot:SAG31_NODE_12910_length_907_cov_0.948020_2_plen_35_part_01
MAVFVIFRAWSMIVSNVDPSPAMVVMNGGVIFTMA